MSQQKQSDTAGSTLPNSKKQKQSAEKISNSALMVLCQFLIKSKQNEKPDWTWL